MGQKLSNTESFMWALGDNPNLASTMGLVVILSDTPDRQRMRNTIAALLNTVDRLRLRVIETGNPVSHSLEWIVDDQFDLDYHLRFSRIDSPRPVASTNPALLALATRFVNDPFDRTRPLWQFQLVSGLSGGRSALLAKFHHSISDGMGMVRLGLNLLDFDADAEPRPQVDIESAFTSAVNQTGQSTFAENDADDDPESNDRSANPIEGLQRLWDATDGIVTSVRAAGVSLTGGPKPSELWSTRSRNRRYEVVIESLEAMKAQAEARKVTINDLFVTACAQAALHYHTESGIDLEHVLATVVINLSPPDAGGGPSADEENAFLPVALEIPGSGASLDERLAAVRAAIREKREQLTGKSSALDSLASLGTIVPPAMAAKMMVEQAGRVDFATSNVPGLPLPAWCSGSEAEAMYPVGPVTGTAFNATLLSYASRSYIGLHIDPAAVDDTELLAKSLGRSFRELGVARL